MIAFNGVKSIFTLLHLHQFSLKMKRYSVDFKNQFLFETQIPISRCLPLIWYWISFQYGTSRYKTDDSDVKFWISGIVYKTKAGINSQKVR
jgi:hypothetical protein